jgi:hypothetical protein
VTDFDEICEEAIASARPLGAAADFIEACRLYLAQRRFPDDESCSAQISRRRILYLL